MTNIKIEKTNKFQNSISQSTKSYNKTILQKSKHIKIGDLKLFIIYHWYFGIPLQFYLCQIYELIISRGFKRNNHNINFYSL